MLFVINQYNDNTKEEDIMSSKKRVKSKSVNSGKRKFMNIRWDRPKITLLFCSIALLIPMIFFVYVLFSAYANTGKPILGNRFNGDLDPAIQSSEITTVQSDISRLENVEEVNLVLKIATVRIYVVVSEVVEKESYAEIASMVYEEAIKTWPEDKYFSVINGLQKQYDIEIHVLNTMTDVNSENFTYYILVKNSSMAEPLGQLVSEAINPELAIALRERADEKNNPIVEDANGDDIDVPSGLNEEPEDIGE